MLNYLKLFLWQLLKIIFVITGFIIGIVIGFYLASLLPSGVFQKITIYFFLIVGTLGGAFIGIMLHRGRMLNPRQWLGELLLTTLAMLSVIAGTALGIGAGVKTAASLMKSDGVGLSLLFILFGALVGTIPGIIVGAASTALWKYKRE